MHVGDWTVPSRVVLFCTTTHNVFNHNVCAIFIFNKKNTVLAKKGNFSTEVDREFTLLLPGVAHLVAVKTARADF